MDMAMEEKIAKAFLYGNKRDRFLFERSKRQRLAAICKLPSIIDQSFVVMHGTTVPSPVALVETMRSFGVGSMCYILSEYQDGFDGDYISLSRAVEKVHCNGFPSLIVGLPSGFSHFKEESHASYQPNCFLKPSIRFDGIPWE